MLGILKDYIKSQFTNILLYFVSVTLLSYMITILYNVEKEKIIYPLVIVSLIYCFYFIFNFIKFYKKYIILDTLINQKENTYTEITKNNHILENKYITIINKLQKENKKIIDTNRNKNKEIEAYYLMWTHQIKTPISAIYFLIENLEDDSKLKLEAEVFKIEEYVNNNLAYFKLDSSNNDFLIETINLKDLLKGIIKKYANLFFLKKLKLEFNVTDKFIVSDKKYLSLILEQVISNAIKYTKNEGVIKIYNENNTIIIEDNGIGIKKEDIPRIFDKGFTGYNGRLNKKSTGIGLYLSKIAADKLNHSIKIESNQNKGTTVKIKISSM